jgi:hypothetical protein
MSAFRTVLKKTCSLFCASLAIIAAIAQQNPVEQIKSENPFSIAIAPLRFLASDELMGRATARPEIHIAARYIAEEYRSLGLKEFKEAPDYFQSFAITMNSHGKSGTISIQDKVYKNIDQFIQVEGQNLQSSAPLVYAGFGTREELEKLDIRGKIVISKMGYTDSSKWRESLKDMREKSKSIQDKGGLALIELFRPMGIDWGRIVQYFQNDRPKIDEGLSLPVFLLNENPANLPQNQTMNGQIEINEGQVKKIPAENVVGWVEGTDPKLKDQFIVLSAHYDHLGVAKQPKLEEGKLDSIYNGARDNAVGVTAVIAAARYFSAHPAKRSILFIAYTGEEIGEIGSRYFSLHPVIALNHLVYNLNIDNANYNDTSIVTVIGLGRTSTDDHIKKASAAFRLTATPDPAPEQNLFDRSDNVNLADKGIPSPTFSLGIKTFDDEINKRYHQLSDEVGNFDLNYALRYIYAFILSAKYIADDPLQPLWISGDKYEAAWKELFKK